MYSLISESVHCACRFYYIFTGPIQIGIRTKCQTNADDPTTINRISVGKRTLLFLFYFHYFTKLAVVVFDIKICAFFSVLCISSWVKYFILETLYFQTPKRFSPLLAQLPLEKSKSCVMLTGSCRKRMPGKTAINTLAITQDLF